MKTFLNSWDPVLLLRMEPRFRREETELAVGLLLWRTVLECLDSLAALLTKSDSLPDCNHERWMDVKVCALTQSHRWMLGWMDRSLGCGRWRSVGQYSLLLSLSVFSKDEMARQKLKRKRLSQPWRGAGGPVEKGRVDRRREHKGQIGLLWSRASLGVALNTQILRYGNSPGWGGRTENTAFPHSPEKKRHTCGSYQSKLFGSHWRRRHIRKDLLHRYIQHVLVISCMALL